MTWKELTPDLRPTPAIDLKLTCLVGDKVYFIGKQKTKTPGVPKPRQDLIVYDIRENLLQKFCLILIIANNAWDYIDTDQQSAPDVDVSGVFMVYSRGKFIVHHHFGFCSLSLGHLSSNGMMPAI